VTVVGVIILIVQLFKLHNLALKFFICALLDRSSLAEEGDYESTCY